MLLLTPLIQMKQNKLLLLDRDGVINHDPGDYTMSLGEFHINPGVLEQLAHWTNEGYSIAIITNQGGIAKGLYTLNDFLEIDAFMAAEFKTAGIAYLATYFCPHHESVSRCLCRKPRGGMIEKAMALHRGDYTTSLMVGDKPRDVIAANEAGVRGMVIDVNQDLRTVKLPEIAR